ncbi:MAG: potassium channel protein [Thermomicrobiales bacterium]
MTEPPASESNLHVQSLRLRLALSLLAFPALAAIGAMGYMLIEGWSFSDALFMAATTITTVGFGEVQPLSENGRIFTIGLLVVGLGAIWYALSVLVGIVVEGELGHRLEKRRMERRVADLSGHQIVCGFGRVGRQTAESLRRLGREVVVIDRDPLALSLANGAKFLTVEGDAAEDASLVRAGIERAGGLVTALGNDAENVFVTLSARALNSGLSIVARANEAGSIPKLVRAGAAQVVSPYDMAGRQMARLALRPATVNFVEDLFRGDGGGLLVEDVRIEAGSPLDGLTIAEAHQLLPRMLILAIRRSQETMAPPPPDLHLAGGDLVAAVGAEPDLLRLERNSQQSAIAPSGGRS